MNSLEVHFMVDSIGQNTNPVPVFLWPGSTMKIYDATEERDNLSQNNKGVKTAMLNQEINLGQDLCPGIEHLTVYQI